MFVHDRDVNSEILHAGVAKSTEFFSGFTSTNLGTHQIMNGWRRNTSIKSVSPSEKVVNIFQHQTDFGKGIRINVRK